MQIPVEGRGKQEESMRAVTVYRVDYARKTRYSVGFVLEQRKTERGNNYKDLMRLARRQFALGTADAVNILIDVSQARRTYLPEVSRECSAE